MYMFYLNCLISKKNYLIIRGKRIDNLEKRAISSKDILTLQEASVYIGVSLSQLYKLTSTQSIPHYKPRGKMCYFEKKELDAWLLRNHNGPDIIINNE